LSPASPQLSDKTILPPLDYPPNNTAPTGLSDQEPREYGLLPLFLSPGTSDTSGCQQIEQTFQSSTFTDPNPIPQPHSPSLPDPLSPRGQLLVKVHVVGVQTVGQVDCRLRWFIIHEEATKIIHSRKHVSTQPSPGTLVPFSPL